MSGKGKLIVLEGVDSAELEALAERLCRWLCSLGIAVDQTREPTMGPVGVQIRLAQQGRLQFDPASLALLSVADRLDHLESEEGILASIARGRHVVCARYILFSCASQWDRIDPDWLMQIDAQCRLPDLTLFVDSPVSQSDQGRREEVERLRSHYVEAIRAWRGVGSRIVCVDGGGPRRDVALALAHPIAALLGVSFSAETL